MVACEETMGVAPVGRHRHYDHAALTETTRHMIEPSLVPRHNTASREAGKEMTSD